MDLLSFLSHVGRLSLRLRGVASVRFEAADEDGHAYVLEGRGDGPPVILLHGLGSGATPLGPVMCALRKHVRLAFAPELPGHAFSGPPRSGRITPEGLLAYVEEVIPRFVDEPAVVVGNSLGGALALRYASRNPDRVRGVIAVSPAGAAIRRESMAELRSAFAMKDRAAAMAFIDRLYARRPSIAWWIAPGVRDLMTRPWIQEFLREVSDADTVKPAELEKLDMPVLLVWGAEEKLLPPESLDYWREHLPRHAVIERPEGWGHSPQLEVPGSVAERIRVFVGGL